MILKHLGDTALVIIYRNKEKKDLPRQVKKDYYSLKGQVPEGILDIVPGYGSIGIYYDPERTDAGQVEKYIYDRLQGQVKPVVDTGQNVTVPVYYGGAYGPDLAAVAGLLSLDEEEVIRRHCGQTYTVWSIGFLPGFPYMGPLPKSLVVPRKAMPAPRVRAGSVAIAGHQTGIYPCDSPGGWHVIGWTPLVLFDPQRSCPCLLNPGDTVKFLREG